MTEPVVLLSQEVRTLQDDRDKEKKVLKFITLVRCTYAFLVLVYFTLWLLVGSHADFGLSTKLILGGVIEIFLFTGVCCVLLLKNRFIRPITYVGMMHDAILAAFIVLLTGYYGSPFLYLFLIIPLYGGITLQRRGGILGAVMVMIVLLGLYFALPLSYRSLPVALQDVVSPMPTLSGSLSSRFLFLSLAAFGVGILTGQLAYQYVRVSKNLVRISQDFIDKKSEFKRLSNNYVSLLDSLPIAIVSFDPQTGRIVYWNDAAKPLIADIVQRKYPEKWNGLQKAHAGEGKDDIEKWNDLEAWNDIEDTLLPDMEIPQDQQDWMITVGQRYLRIARFALVLKNSTYPGYQISDVTSQQNALIERSKRQRLELLGEFSAKVAHEIRNPLACISGCNEMLQSDAQDDEQRQILQMMGDEIDRLNSLLNDILVFARSPRLRMEPLRVLSRLEHQRDIFLSDTANRGIAVHIEVAPETVFVMDENSFSQIVMTLWRNSSEAMEGQGTIRVECATESGEIDFYDSGPGLRPELGQRVFEPFFTTKDSGTGLGLAIARQLASDNHCALGWDVEKGCFFLRREGEASKETGE